MRKVRTCEASLAIPGVAHLRADADGAAYEWCLNLTGWVSLSDGCHGQYRFCGSHHHQTADCPETQAAARAAAAEAEAAWAVVAAAAAMKMQAHWRGQQSRRATEAATEAKFSSPAAR